MPSIWLSRPPEQAVSLPVKPGQLAPALPPGEVLVPWRLLAFMRHVGCPFAENTVKQLRQWADQHPQVAVQVVSHGDVHITSAWLQEIGGLGRLQWIHDADRQLYGQWGLGYVRFWHFGGPASLLGVVRLWFGRIRNRMATGTRWQGAGTFLIRQERVVWAHVPNSAQVFMLPTMAQLSDQ